MYTLNILWNMYMKVCTLAAGNKNLHVRHLVPFDGDDINRGAMPYRKQCQCSRISRILGSKYFTLALGRDGNIVETRKVHRLSTYSCK